MLISSVTPAFVVGCTLGYSRDVCDCALPAVASRHRLTASYCSGLRCGCGNRTHVALVQVILNPLHDAEEKVTSQGFHQRVMAAARKQSLLMAV